MINCFFKLIILLTILFVSCNKNQNIQEKKEENGEDLTSWLDKPNQKGVSNRDTSAIFIPDSIPKDKLNNRKKLHYYQL